MKLILFTFLFFISLVFSFPAQAQGGQVAFFEYLTDDSVKLFFNDRFNFTNKECASYNRYVRLNEEGVYNGDFIDLDNDGDSLGAGNYTDGKKHGTFLSYYPEGRLHERRIYERGVPVGTWHTYHKNGTVEKILQFTDQDTLLIRFVDKEGKALVVNGNGRFEGPVAGYAGKSSGSLTASGEIVNGKPDGKWTSKYLGRVYANEEYSKGKFVGGVFPHAVANKKYKINPHLNTFILPNYVTDLERLLMENCEDAKRSTPTALHNAPALNSAISKKIYSYLHELTRYGETSIGKNVMIIEFTLDAQGKPQEFVMLSTWGTEFYPMMMNAIKREARFEQSGNKIYFHFELNRITMDQYIFRFWFSNFK